MILCVCIVFRVFVALLARATTAATLRAGIAVGP
jgi:hypothetical protein